MAFFSSWSCITCTRTSRLHLRIYTGARRLSTNCINSTRPLSRCIYHATLMISSQISRLRLKFLRLSVTMRKSQRRSQSWQTKRSPILSCYPSLATGWSRLCPQIRTVPIQTQVNCSNVAKKYPEGKTMAWCLYQKVPNQSAYWWTRQTNQNLSWVFFSSWTMLILLSMCRRAYLDRFLANKGDIKLISTSASPILGTVNSMTSSNDKIRNYIERSYARGIE